MKMHIWNAFASNNSGSYTLVGRFPDEALATEVAAELAQVSVEHDAWRQKQEPQGGPGAQGPSPLDAFMERHGLKPDGMGTGEDWPLYSGDTTPKVWALGHQVFVHHAYTLTLPSAYGEFFYKRGGRVELELEHTHHPLVALFHLYVPWQERTNLDVPFLALQVLEELHADDGPLVQLAAVEPLPAWSVGEHRGEADMLLGAAFKDLVAGFTAVNRIAQSRGFHVQVKLSEAPPQGDALAFLRPCSPPLPVRELFDVLVTAVGPKPSEVIEALEELRDLYPRDAKALLATMPVVARQRLPRSVAETVANQLHQTGASTELRRSKE